MPWTCSILDFCNVRVKRMIEPIKSLQVSKVGEEYGLKTEYISSDENTRRGPKNPV
jgi:hypothetical protein